MSPDTYVLSGGVSVYVEMRTLYRTQELITLVDNTDPVRLGTWLSTTDPKDIGELW